jgi:D-glycero-alpha-D-manno-heptose-7-phosphate kinase
MIISRTPYRISFFGGGTDYPGWFRENGGAVLGTSINKYCYITCRYLPPFFDHRFRIQYTRTEGVSSIDEIAHPAVREVLRFLDFSRGLEIHHDGDLPARSGMGSSSAFTVGLLHSLYALRGEMPSKHRLAMESIHIEQDMIRETVGSQDQVLTSFGGFNVAQFEPNGDVLVRPVTIPAERRQELGSRFMLFFTRVPRTASQVADSYVPRLRDKKTELCAMREMVDEAAGILASDRDIDDFGRLMHECWKVKRSLGEGIATDHITEVYAAARAAGALGGKVLGAGGGGFMLFFVPPERQDAVREALRDLLWVPFRFEHHGSQIIFFGEEEDYSEHEARPCAPEGVSR